MKKNLCLTTMIFIIFYAVFSFCPVILEEVSWFEKDMPTYFAGVRTGVIYGGVFSPGQEYYGNLYLGDRLIGNNFFGSVVTVLGFISLIGVGLCFFEMYSEYINKENKYKKIFSFSPYVSLLCLVLQRVWNYFHSQFEEEWYYDEIKNYTYHTYDKYNAHWGLYVLFALIIIICILNFLIMFNKVPNDIAETKKVEKINTADELKAYKELLDSGAITQEEFDAKKKQLLKL